MRVEPFFIAIPDARLAAIRARVAAYDWDSLPDAGGWDAGVGKADLRRLMDAWLHRFDWRGIERRLNALPQYRTEIEGERIHFVHAAGDGRKPPLLLLHGWPGSFAEFEALVAPLAADGYDVAVPSLPGFAFSNPISGILGPRRIAGLMHRLATQLFGGRRYIVQGGDWGAHIASWMAHLYPAAVLGIHLNMVSIYAEDAEPASADDRALLARRRDILRRETGYNLEQETRPQTLGVAMTDSPVGQAAWMLEKFGMWADLPRRADGSPDLWARFTEDDLLTQIMLYVGPRAEATATWIYRGKRLEGSDRFPAGTRVTVPTAIAAFPDPVFLPTPQDFAAATYNVVRYTPMPAGGHFAALEAPQALLADLRAFAASVV